MFRRPSVFAALVAVAVLGIILAACSGSSPAASSSASAVAQGVGQLGSESGDASALAQAKYVQLYGKVSAIAPPNAAGDRHFKIVPQSGGAPQEIVARPGVTKVLQGYAAPQPLSAITVGRWVHVTGTWMATTNQPKSLLAAQVRLRK